MGGIGQDGRKIPGTLAKVHDSLSVQVGVLSPAKVYAELPLGLRCEIHNRVTLGNFVSLTDLVKKSMMIESGIKS